MQSLQVLTVQNILDNLTVNEETTPILDEFVINYLNNNKNLLNQYLDQNGLYHVYYRQKDCSTNKRQKNIMLLKSFVTEGAAIKWIVKNGEIIVDENEPNYIDERVVLTIVPSDNYGVYVTGNEPSCLSGIATRKYLNFAFSPSGYEMLLKENKRDNDLDINDKNPTWIHYYKEDGTHIIGASIKELQNIGSKQSLIDHYR